jgi:hypothetical protein
VVASLERFRHVREWDLKISYELSKLVTHLDGLSDAAASMAAEIEAAAPGRRYLLERKHAELTRREAPAVARSLAADLLRDLGARAERVIELEIPAHREGLPVVVDAALLVHDSRVDELRRAASERESQLAALGVHAALTGPWAPYRFMAEESHE